jgi:tetratricopeptide (TPR) repeat protein
LTRYVLLLLLSLAAAGCSQHVRSGPYSPQQEIQRDSQAAQKLTGEAADLMQRNPARAEKLLREALTLDLYHGPAHNNLGVLYLSQGKLYEAASEFQWASRLLPGHPDPRINLALVMESAGRTDDALKAYTSALAVYPDHIAAIQGLVRLQVKRNKTDGSTETRLADIALRGTSEQWRTWAQGRLNRLKP